MVLSRVLAALAFAVALAPACSTDPDSGAQCHAGDRVACSCPGGNGTSSCVDGVFAACDCAGVPGTEAASGPGGAGGANAGGADTGGAGAATGGGGASTGGGGSGGAPGLPFGAPCTDNSECASMLCYAFGMGSKCTIPCPPDPADCPNGGKGCNAMAPAVCKP